MPSKKWQRLMQESSASFRRGRPQRTPAAAILIVTEGVVSEPTYFRELKRRLALRTVELIVEPAGMGDPRKLAERACVLHRERKAAVRRGRLGNFQPGGFDQLWIVFDTDVPERHGKLRDGLGFAEANGVRCAHSTPCFEFWLLLHVHFTTAPMRVCAEAVARLSDQLGKAYTKNGDDAQGLIPPLLAQLDQALTHAERVRAHHAAAGTAFPPNPSTELDQLIRAIRETASPRTEKHLP